MTTRRTGVILAAVVFLTVGAIVAQQDFFTAVDPANTVAPVRVIGTGVTTGTWVSRANYSEVFALITKGHITDATTAARYVILQDSIAGVAVALVDSALLDTVDNQLAKIRYTGVKSHLRILTRAMGAATDTTHIAAVIVRGGARTR